MYRTDKGGNSMIKDIEYSVLKENKRAYEIMLLRDQYDNTFADIAKEYEISVGRVRQIYIQIKIKQIRLYINHISVKLGHENTFQVRKIYNEAYECYQEWTYACAYLEKKYKDILDEYRNGEPGMSTQFIKHMLPFKAKLSKKTIERIIVMRENEKLSFIAIGKKLKITQSKAMRVYEWFYHKKFLELIKVLQEKTENQEEKRAIRDYYFRGYKTAKKRYDMIIENNPFLSDKTLNN